MRVPVPNLFFLTCISIASCFFSFNQYRNPGPNQNLTLGPNPNTNPNPHYKPNPNPTINPLFTSFYFLRNEYTGYGQIIGVPGAFIRPMLARRSFMISELNRTWPSSWIEMAQACFLL
jgi:hypothetical protein